MPCAEAAVSSYKWSGGGGGGVARRMRVSGNLKCHTCATEKGEQANGCAWVCVLERGQRAADRGRNWIFTLKGAENIRLFI
ncbi:hypothetical protein SLEP1_g48163 [Rubroshorea leprosula]|uniref:Uncharacterized protein n=1 Tax=Rubroshorea leprosula TaxID=152421 RepID=A0AAV5LTP6_9ROSI|nr:hypothetical protein SLEP1_g48163 [Rubroshorea leprosula]